MGNPEKGWTPERRKLQSEAIKRWKQWEQSTGPKSPEGKAAVSGNALTGGQSVQLREPTKTINSLHMASRERVSNLKTS
ncbi:hypothetical protein [Polaromonas eurypsychrophila]|nr:hypothetical protein [Polaromonas eurypsychrophila]